MITPQNVESVFTSYEKLPHFDSIPYLALLSVDKESQKPIFLKQKEDFKPQLLDLEKMFHEKKDEEAVEGKSSDFLFQPEEEKSESDEPKEEIKEEEQQQPSSEPETTGAKTGENSEKEVKEDSAPPAKENERKEEGEKGKTKVKEESEDNSLNVYALKLNFTRDYYLLMESSDEINDETKTLLNFIRANILATVQTCFSSSNQKYKDELLKLREFQARLFPKFDNVTNMDIASVYLPADLMSGNFVDASYVNEDIYQILICTVDGYDASSAFTAASIRTIIKTNSGKRIVPSAMIQLILKKLDKIIQGLHSLIHITIVQINVKSGDCRLSSLGAPNLIYASPSAKKIEGVNASPTGKILSKRKDFMDISIHLNPGDILLYYSNGITKAYSNRENEQYGINRLARAMYNSIKEESVFITHAITDSIYEFTEYSTFEEDIILLAAKRTTEE